MPLTQIDSSMIPSSAIDASKLASQSVTQPKMGTGVAGNGPAFSAYQSSAQTLSSSVATKLNFQTEEFDTDNCFDNATNMRFTPNVAGYYRINAGIQYNTTSASCLLQLYKNGSNYKNLPYSSTAVPSGYGSALVYLNRTTDYVEIYATIGSGQALATGVAGTYFQASLERAA